MKHPCVLSRMEDVFSTISKTWVGWWMQCGSTSDPCRLQLVWPWHVWVNHDHSRTWDKNCLGQLYTPMNHPSKVTIVHPDMSDFPDHGTSMLRTLPNSTSQHVFSGVYGPATSPKMVDALCLVKGSNSMRTASSDETRKGHAIACSIWNDLIGLANTH